MRAIDGPVMFKPDPVRPPIGHGDQGHINGDRDGTLAGSRQGAKTSQ